jgi:hypothetical protein
MLFKKHKLKHHAQITSGKKDRNSYQHQFGFSVPANQPKMQNHVLKQGG